MNILGILDRIRSHKRTATGRAFQSACEAVGQGDLSTALGLLQRCCLREPSTPQYHETLGNILIGLDQYEASTSAFLAALKLDPRRAISHHGLGAAYHRLGRMSEAIQAWGAMGETRRLAAMRAGISPDVRYLPGMSWTAGIGHIALLDVFAKAKRLGLTDSRYIILADQVANSAYLSLWRDFEVISAPEEIDSHRTAADLASEMPTVIFLDGRWRWIHDAANVVEARWTGGPLLRLTDEQKERGRSAIRLPSDAWFVTLHVREDAHGSIRNADPLAYLPMIEEVGSRGGWVVRIGDLGSTALPHIPNVIDLTRKPKDDWAHVYALAEPKLFVGTNSGPAWAAGTFGTQLALTNWSPPGIHCHYRHALLPKRLWSDALERHLTEMEEQEEPFAFMDTAAQLEKNGVSAIANTPEEIRAFVARELTAAFPWAQ